MQEYKAIQNTKESLYVKFYVITFWCKKQTTLQKKVFIDEEELDSIEEIDGILNLENLPKAKSESSRW